ncbi:MAG TPA: non-canonical purine NTP pyrophosphatase [Nevskiaceae bacterium]|nr:non-canonical purine NTP pyrophosphatase [Nevskiaceae bacterium]
MKDITFITGNQGKANYLAKWLGIPMSHKKLDLDEIQSLDLQEVVEHKVRQAYGRMQSPVLVEDVALTFTAMGRLPGTLIKWFLEELDVDGLCKLADGLQHRNAEAAIMYALFDGKALHTFEAMVPGTIAATPQDVHRDNSWAGSRSWNSIFIPQGATKTYAAMSDDELKPFSHRAQAIEKLKSYLQS